MHYINACFISILTDPYPMDAIIQPQVRSLEIQETGTKQYDIWIRRFIDRNYPLNEDGLKEFFENEVSGFSPSTQRLAKVALKQAILKSVPFANDTKFLIQLDTLFKTLKTPKPTLHLGDSKLLSNEEIQEIFHILNPKYAMLVEALYETGARISELLKIQLKDCKILKDAVEIRIIGKRNKEGRLTLSRKLFQEIRLEFKGNTYLFENMKTKNHYKRQIVHRNLYRAGYILGRIIHPHQFRHSRVTHLLEAGFALDAVSRFARHSDPGFTARVYGHSRLKSQDITKTAIRRKK